VSFYAITLCVAFQRVFIVVYSVTDSVRKLLDAPSYVNSPKCQLSDSLLFHVIPDCDVRYI
jgi:hypothetical protein